MQNRLLEIAGNMAEDGAASDSSNPDLQARGALLLLFEFASSLNEFAIRIQTWPLQCPNCGSPATGARSPYCSESCRCEAAFVRQTRAAVSDGAILASDRQIALGENFWRVLGGGFPRRQQMVLPRVLKKVLERADGKCEVCWQPAVTVDHIGSG